MFSHKIYTIFSNFEQSEDKCLSFLSFSFTSMKKQPVPLLLSAFIVPTLVILPVLVQPGSFWVAFLLHNQRGHCLPMILHWYTWTTFEQQSNVPNSDFIERGVHAWTHTMHIRMHTLGKSHQDIWIVFGCPPLLPSQSPLPASPATYTSLQLRFYIPVRQNYFLVHNVSQISSWFGHRRLEDMNFSERVWAVLMKWNEDLLDWSAGITGVALVTYSVISLWLLDKHLMLLPY